MRYLIIGLGIYGSNLARDLAVQGNEVIGADKNPALCDQIKDDIATVYTVDSTDNSALDILPISAVDIVVVAIGEDFGASIKTVALLLQAKANTIFARAADPLHRAVLQAFGVQRILTPEQTAANQLAVELLLGTDATVMPIDQDRMIVKTTLPQHLVGKQYAQITQPGKNMRIIAAARKKQCTSIIGIKTTELQPIDLETEAAQNGDTVTVLTTPAAIKKWQS